MYSYNAIFIIYIKEEDGIVKCNVTTFSLNHECTNVFKWNYLVVRQLYVHNKWLVTDSLIKKTQRYEDFVDTTKWTLSSLSVI